jgi:predicted nucleic acid-binding protein
MGQVTIYLDTETENKLKQAAKSSHISVSKWVASVIKEKITTEWPQDVVKLAGSWKDDFPTIELESLVSRIARSPLRIKRSRNCCNDQDKAGKSWHAIGPYDTLIAGIALSSNATLVTHNTKELSRVKGLSLEDWF